MRRKALKIGSLVALPIVLILVALAAHADDDSKHQHRRIHKIAISGDHGDHPLLEMFSAKGGYLGVTLTELTPELRTHFGVPEKIGVMVSRVVDDSPAQRAGVRVGDIISGVDGEEVGSSRSLKKRISSHDDGEAATLEIWRDGQMETLTANLETREGIRPHLLSMGCEDEDCDFDFNFDMEDFDMDFDMGNMKMEFLHGKGFHMGCGDSEDCTVKMTCDGGDCECIVNGEESDCSALHHFKKLHNKHRE